MADPVRRGRGGNASSMSGTGRHSHAKKGRFASSMSVVEEEMLRFPRSGPVSGSESVRFEGHYRHGRCKIGLLLRISGKCGILDRTAGEVIRAVTPARADGGGAADWQAVFFEGSTLTFPRRIQVLLLTCLE